VLSVSSAETISEDLSLLFRDKAKLYCETGDFLIGLKPEQRVQFRKLILDKVVKAGWDVLSGDNVNPYKHHFLFEVKNS
jgi:hypothetical protein